jgi:hypothetical protein
LNLQGPINSPKHNFTNRGDSANDSIALSIIPSQPQDITAANPVSSPLSERFDDAVPSSQSQYFLPFESQRCNESFSVDFVPSSQSQYMPPTNPGPIQRDDDGFVVPSSQSQCLLSREGAENFGVSQDIIARVADDEVIPSSQSQLELELLPRRYRSPSRAR